MNQPTTKYAIKCSTDEQEQDCQNNWLWYFRIWFDYMVPSEDLIITYEEAKKMWLFSDTPTYEEKLQKLREEWILDNDCVWNDYVKSCYRLYIILTENKRIKTHNKMRILWKQKHLPYPSKKTNQK